jgi:signal transduction histidine kinase
VSGEIQLLDRLVTDLLAITGRRLGKRESSDLAALAAKRVALLAPWAGEMGITFVVNGAAEADIDRDAVGRALDNLLRNAAQASSRDATVSVTLDMHDAEARVTVTDRGPGVSPEHTTQLFEPFFTTRSEGTGLGLALSRSIAAAHGGTLVYERTGGETRFVLSLPSHAPSREHV